MKTSKFTTMELKKINKSSIYHFIYNARQTSKQETASALFIGLTTVSQNLKLLEEEGLITRQGFFASTGGRKANILQIVADYKISIGIEILKDRIHLAAVNLYGELAASRTIQTPFLSDCGYCQALAKELDTFLLDYGIEASKILGVSIALQGIVSQDGSQIIYGKLLHEPDLSLSNFQNYIPFPCRLEHDSKAAAYREIWHKKEFKDSLILLLNENLGSALVIDGKIRHGLHGCSTTLEHLCLDSHGPACYCGQKGCLETYCSAQSLQQAWGNSLESFFSSLRQGETTARSLWNRYLENLAQAIKSFTLMLDVPIILSGYLSPYLHSEDLEKIYAILESLWPFPLSRDFLYISSHGPLSPAAGAALSYIEDFLEEL